MNALHHDVQRMLRWYPRRWRLQHGEALIDLHMDRAEAAGASPSDDIRLSPEDSAAIRAAGLFERTRHSLPIVTSAFGVALLVAGYVLALAGNNAVGNPLWLLAGPTLLSLSLWSLRASLDARWSIQTAVPALASVLAVMAFFAAANTAILRDEVGVVPSVAMLWTFGALGAAFVGIAVAIAMAPSFQRSGMRRDWAFTLGFLTGVVGGGFLVLGVLSGLGAAIAGAVLVWLSSRSARRGSGGQPIGAELLELA